MLVPVTKYRYFNICEDGTFSLTDHLKPTAEWKSPTAEWNYLVCTPLSAELLSNELKSFRWVAS